MKIAPIMRAIAESECSIRGRLLHTGQHYDSSMKQSFFDQLCIPEPDIDLEVGSGSHAQQTAEIMKRFEPVLESEKPHAILVVGDVNSTIACALVAAKKDIPVIHVEAGLRSGDRRMPEEVNRILTDQLSDLLFTTEMEAEQNLIREGIDRDKIHFVGNVMIDTLLFNMEAAVPAEVTLEARGISLNENKYGLVTLHRPSNVDDPVALRDLLTVLGKISKQTNLVFPMHPRTASRVREFGLSDLLDSFGIEVLPPVGYLEMLGLMRGARIVLTDSGGIQEESTALGIPCITLRENTERPITVSQGTNTLVGTDANKILACHEAIFAGGGKTGRIPPLWDGQAAQRIVHVLDDWVKGFV